MSNTQMNENYQREDIYYCECCASFRDMHTNKVVDISLYDMPAEMAIQVLSDIMKLEKIKQRPTNTRRRPRGFGK